MLSFYAMNIIETLFSFFVYLISSVAKFDFFIYLLCSVLVMVIFVHIVRKVTGRG